MVTSTGFHYIINTVYFFNKIKCIFCKKKKEDDVRLFLINSSRYLDNSRLYDPMEEIIGLSGSLSYYVFSIDHILWQEKKGWNQFSNIIVYQ